MANFTCDSQPLVTASIAAMLFRYIEDPDRPILMDNVQIERDANGNYKPMITVTMRSGTKLRVIVAEVP